eukprot:SAG11_NODE_26202_length_348_cov_1.036145_2_plen_60_part_01
MIISTPTAQVELELTLLTGPRGGGAENGEFEVTLMLRAEGPYERSQWIEALWMTSVYRRV